MTSNKTMAGHEFRYLPEKKILLKMRFDAYSVYWLFENTKTHCIEKISAEEGEKLEGEGELNKEELPPCKLLHRYRHSEYKENPARSKFLKLVQEKNWKIFYCLVWKTQYNTYPMAYIFDPFGESCLQVHGVGEYALDQKVVPISCKEKAVFVEYPWNLAFRRHETKKYTIIKWKEFSVTVEYSCTDLRISGEQIFGASIEIVDGEKSRQYKKIWDNLGNIRQEIDDALLAINQITIKNAFKKDDLRSETPIACQLDAHFALRPKVLLREGEVKRDKIVTWSKYSIFVEYRMNAAEPSAELIVGVGDEFVSYKKIRGTIEIIRQEINVALLTITPCSLYSCRPQISTCE